MRSAAPLVLLLAFSSGCSHPLLLKKYAATSPPVPALKGRAVFVAPFADESRREWTSSEPLPDPTGWEYRALTSQQLDQWDVERRKLGDDLPVSQLHPVGHKRNGFGIPIMEVFSVNTPAEWLTEATRLEIAAQGAIAAATAESADVVVQGVVRYVWLDLYMVTWVHIVLDLTTTPRGQNPKTVRLHLSDGKLAWSGGDTESFELFCSTEQKLQRYLLKELARAVAEAAVQPAAL